MRGGPQGVSGEDQRTKGCGPFPLPSGQFLGVGMGKPVGDSLLSGPLFQEVGRRSGLAHHHLIPSAIGGHTPRSPEPRPGPQALPGANQQPFLNLLSLCTWGRPPTAAPPGRCSPHSSSKWETTAARVNEQPPLANCDHPSPCPQLFSENRGEGTNFRRPAEVEAKTGHDGQLQKP